MKLFKKYPKGASRRIEPDEIESYYGHGTHVHPGHSPEAGKERSDSVNYVCPMKCEGEKTYNHPGNCSVCNMKLVPVNNV